VIPRALLEIIHRDLVAVAASRHKRRLVADVLEIRTTQAGRAARDELQLDVVRKREFLGVNAKDALAPPQVGQVHHHLSV
jgi:hypothetical protein